MINVLKKILLKNNNYKFQSNNNYLCNSRGITNNVLLFNIFQLINKSFRLIYIIHNNYNLTFLNK